MRRKIASGAGLASRKPSASWALSSSAASRAGASSRSNGSPGRIACGRSCKPSNRGCVGGCINRFLSKENGWDRSSRATSTITPCRPTVRRLLRSASWSPNSGNDRSGGAVRTMVRLGSGSRGWPKTGSPNRSSFIHGRKYASPSRTQGGSRMRESRLYGSVRGALSNERPYRDRCARNDGVAAFPVHSRAVNSSLAIKHRWRLKPAEFAFDQLGKLQRRGVFQPRADDLNADRQSIRREAGRNRGRGQAGQRGDAGPCELIGIDKILAVDLDAAAFLLGRMIVRIGRRRHDRTDDRVECLEQLAPLRPQP